MGTRTEYSKRERNIPLEVFESWQANRRKDDARELVKYCKKSLPVIYAALNRGFVSKAALAEKITEYYLKRPAEIVKVSSKAKELINRNKFLDGQWPETPLEI